LKPIPQSIFVSTGVRGDCFRACVASILELPIEDVPHFVAIEKDWWGEVQRWLAKWDLFALWIRVGEDFMLGWPAETTYCILNGESPRAKGRKHCVVARLDGWNFEVVHDPHPEGGGIVGTPESAVLFVPMHPERLAANTCLAGIAY
jgi:hypothetical protein